ncbi:hypothetical protein, partial [Pantoea sp.]|uniref:hypothetical protein n=1 Tax=Pantoea sp. TaxID=69393 RepID=UPI0028AE5D93
PDRPQPALKLQCVLLKRAAAEVLWPARLHACLQKKLPRLTVTAFAHLTLTDRHDTHRCRFFIADQG